MSTETDDFLAHYGVKGMRWGVKRGDGPSGRSEARAARAKNEAKVAAARKQKAATRDESILNARKNMESGRQDLQIAKTQYRQERKVVGRREARKQLSSARADFKVTKILNEETATMLTGKEQTDKMIADIGYLAVKMILSAK